LAGNANGGNVANENGDKIIQVFNDTTKLLPYYIERIVLDGTVEKYSKSRTLDSFTVLYVRAGVIDVNVEGEVIQLTSNFGIGIKQGVSYSIRTVGVSKSEIEILIFNHSAVFGYGTTMMSVSYRDPVINRKSTKYIAFNCRTEPGIGICQQMDAIFYVNATNDFGSELMVMGSLCQIWYLVLRLYKPIPLKKNTQKFSNDEYRVRQAIGFIDSHYMYQITLDDIANSIHISKSECCRCFKRVLDLTPIDYLVRYRIYTAAAILDNPEIEVPAISELALSMGFNNISYFNKMFKRFMDSTPTEYRNSVLKKNNWVDGSTSI